MSLVKHEEQKVITLLIKMKEHLQLQIWYLEAVQYYS
jgi:hypothetical protein